MLNRCSFWAYLAPCQFHDDSEADSSTAGFLAQLVRGEVIKTATAVLGPWCRVTEGKSRALLESFV